MENWLGYGMISQISVLCRPPFLLYHLCYCWLNTWHWINPIWILFSHFCKWETSNIYGSKEKGTFKKYSGRGKKSAFLFEFTPVASPRPQQQASAACVFRQIGKQWRGTVDWWGFTELPELLSHNAELSPPCCSLVLLCAFVSPVSPPAPVWGGAPDLGMLRVSELTLAVSQLWGNSWTEGVHLCLPGIPSRTPQKGVRPSHPICVAPGKSPDLSEVQVLLWREMKVDGWSLRPPASSQIWSHGLRLASPYPLWFHGRIGRRAVGRKVREL